MPANVTKARKDIAQAFGTELIFSDPMEGSDGAIRLVRKIVDEDPDKYFYPDQYSNPGNPLAHYLGTGREILERVGDRITHFVAGLGTSGTMMGTTRRLHEHTRPDPLHRRASRPTRCTGSRGSSTWRARIVPAIYDAGRPDETMWISTEDGWDMADRLAREEGLHVGHSSGANVFAAVKIAEKLHARARAAAAWSRSSAIAATATLRPMKWEKQVRLVSSS